MHHYSRCLLLAALTLMIALRLANPAPADLVGYWKFNDNVLDYSGTGNDGTETNLAYNANVSEIIGYGKSGYFNNAADVTIAADATLDSDVFTLAYWINQDGAIQGGHDRVTSRTSNTFETAVSDTSQIRYFGLSSGWQDTGSSVPSTGWEHVAFVSDGTNMEVYRGGASVYTGPSPGDVGGIMRIGGRCTSPSAEYYEGLIDDVALWNEALGSSRIAALANGNSSPIDEVTVGSDLDWKLSTVRKPGGVAGDWAVPDPLPADWIPDESTFTEAVSESTSSHFDAVTALWDVKQLSADGGNGQPEGVSFYRTTFELDPWPNVLAEIGLAVDNGAQVFINGVEVAREISYLAENWNAPYSTLTIHPDGTVGEVTLFDWTVSSFSNWLPGENELIVAVRNPDVEGDGGGRFAFRMDLHNVPEPSGLILLGTSVFCLLARRRRKKG